MGNYVPMLAIKETLVFFECQTEIMMGKSNLPSGKASPQTIVSQGHISIVGDHK